jgi:hypothetical protein
VGEKETKPVQFTFNASGGPMNDQPAVIRTVATPDPFSRLRLTGKGDYRPFSREFCLSRRLWPSDCSAVQT